MSPSFLTRKRHQTRDGSLLARPARAGLPRPLGHGRLASPEDGGREELPECLASWRSSSATRAASAALAARSSPIIAACAATITSSSAAGSGSGHGLRHVEPSRPLAHGPLSALSHSPPSRQAPQSQTAATERDRPVPGCRSHLLAERANSPPLALVCGHAGECHRHTVAGAGGGRMRWRRWRTGLAVLVALGALTVAGRLLDLGATPPPATLSSPRPTSSPVPARPAASSATPPPTFPSALARPLRLPSPPHGSCPATPP